MIINQTKCEMCLKKDVCGRKDKYTFAVDSIGEANTSNENMSFHKARDNDGIKVTVACPAFFLATSVR